MACQRPGDAGEETVPVAGGDVDAPPSRAGRTVRLRLQPHLEAAERGRGHPEVPGDDLGAV